jgi:hypothetical protein
VLANGVVFTGDGHRAGGIERAVDLHRDIGGELDSGQGPPW